MEQIQVVNKDGKYECDINISTEEWLELLNDSDVTTSITWKTLLGFYHSPNHSAACSAVNPDNPKSPNPVIRHWGERIQERLKRFQVLPTTGEGYTYWVIPMTGYSEGSNFVWTVRPELVQAIDKVFKIQDKLIQDAIEQYKHKLRDDPSYWDGKPGSFGEKYKWEAIAHFQKNWDIDAPDFAEMFKESTAKTRNLLDSIGFPRAMMLDFASIQPKQVEEMFRNLLDENIDLKQRVDNFKQKAKTLLEKYRFSHPEAQKANNHFQDTNTISTYLWLRYPDKYYKYAPGIYCSNRQLLGLYQYYIKDRDRTIDSMLEGFAMYDKIRAMLKDDKELVDMIHSRVDKLHLEKDFEDDFRTATIDFGYFISKYFHSNIQPIQENTTMFENPYQDIVNLLRFKKNVILQGAPGTGKTFSTAAIALGLLGVKNVDYNNHAAVIEKYNKYLEDGNIFFTTFHQSMDYEDFVEGLKPKIDEDDEGNSLVTYEVEDGIFKDVCNCAYGEDNRDSDEDESDNDSESDEFNITNEDHTVWKVILGGTKDNKIREKCLKDGLIAVGWGYGDVDFSTFKFPNVKGDGSRTLPAFQKEMKKGDIVVSEYKTEFFDAIGIIQGDYQYVENAIIENTDFTYVRKVKWIFKGKRKIRSLNKNTNFNRDTVCRLPKINRQKLNNFLAKNKNVEEQTENISEEQEDNNTNSPVILIIDEINRGNVSKIFGELVTLLEKDKREGEDHPITVTLPYSKEDFSVPSNVYIIGTMNTTDRSTGTLDYAIRRRFAFVTLPADREAIQLDIAKELFDDIESFIEDNCPKDMDIDDLMVGHSYFMTEDEGELELKIKYEVIPLLKEYCNDGLLTCSYDELNERIEAWENLEVFDDSSVETEDDTDDDDEVQE